MPVLSTLSWLIHRGSTSKPRSTGTGRDQHRHLLHPLLLPTVRWEKYRGVFQLFLLLRSHPSGDG